ncbi:Anhydro-N-acetylmuramic acid kinase [Mycoplasmopsis californica]|nr:Anhydro-N-acetylmuramic acid kinase [Mycoplasmopsis californica]
MTKIPTIGDFRPADIAVGGQGAPLVVYPDYLLFRHPQETRLLQNIGGIANVTVLDDDIKRVFAFDNGPGNVLIDMAVKHFYNKDFDINGKIASKGKINQAIVDFLLTDQYYQKQPPKTTGREKYDKKLFQLILNKFKSVSSYDIVRTLTFFTAYIIADSYKRFVFEKHKKYTVYLSGGGANNPVILSDLKTLLPDIKVTTSTELGINPDAKEAIEFAILGYLFVKDISSNVPKATGADEFTILGKLAK